MTVDERDVRLGEVLDRAVRRIEVTGSPDVVVRRGSRRRTGVVVASVTAVAVFLGAVGFAATQVGREANGDAGWSTVGDLRADGWTMALPERWIRTPIDRCPPNGDVEGAVFSSVDFAFTDPDGGRIQCESRLVLAGFPTNGIAIAVMPTGLRPGLFQPDETSFPLSLEGLTKSSGVRGGPQESFSAIVVRGDLKAIVRVYVGPDASGSDVEALRRVVSSIRFQGAGAEFASPDLRWTIPIPAGWQAGGAHSVGGPQTMLPDLRTSFVTTSLTATFSGPMMVGAPLPAGIVGSDVIVVVDPFVGTGDAQPTTFAPNAEREDIENQGWSWRDGKICGPTGCARVYIWHGPDASERDLATALSVAEGVRLVATPPDPSRLEPTIGYRDGHDGFSMAYPAGWTVAEENLTPLLASPREILSVGTYPLRPGGKAPIDAYLPKNALADLGAGDVFVTVQESDADAAIDTPRPASFSPTTVCPDDDAACRTGTAIGLEGIRAWWIPFSDPSGRGFYAFVAMGEDAYRDAERSDATWAILDSLSFEGDASIRFEDGSGWTSEALPAPTGADVDGAWTSNVSFVPEGGRCCQAADLLARELSGDEIIVLAWIVGPAEGGPNVNFPAMELPLSLPDEVASQWEGYTPETGRSQLMATIHRRYVQIWIYYGTSDPSEDTRASAQTALDRLIVVPR